MVHRSKFDYRMKEGYLKVHKVHLGIFNYQIDIKGFCLDLLMVSGSQLQVHTYQPPTFEVYYSKEKCQFLTKYYIIVDKL